MKTSIYKKSVLVAIPFVASAFFFFTPDKTALYEIPEAPVVQGRTIDLPDMNNEAFKTGESLSYRLHYGFMDAGVAVLEVLPEIKEIGGRKVYHIVGNGYSKGSFDWFFKVKDRYETYLDKDAMVPWYFVRRCNEGGYIINQDYLFNHYTKKVDIGEGKTCDVPVGIQDMLSSFYYARNIDFTNAKEGDVFTIPSFVDKQVWTLKIKYVGKETISTDLGKFRCIKFRPIIQTGRIFKKEEDLNVWITDDKNHIPLRAQAKIMFGSIKMDLTSYQNLANPMSKVE
ncbi:MAG TPA: DUF3108 domain-containing protein [Bacteroidia bacterium]|jgi:hypothetical protein|nr:DUF3108 domain-containing protein [Bacteroidia bacterium]